MKMIRRGVIWLVLWIMGYSVLAHNPKISTFTLHDTGSGWLLDIQFSRSTIDDMMVRQYGKAQVAVMHKNDFQDKVLEYVQGNFYLNVDGINQELNRGGIKLGNHQTDFRFILPKMALNPHQLNVSIPMFDYAYNHTNIFRIYRGGERVDRWFLHDENDFEVMLEFDATGIKAVDQKLINYSSNLETYLYFGMLIILLTAIYLMRYRKVKIQSSLQ